MATTEIHAITGTPQKALDYVMSDKTEEYLSEDELHKDCDYRLFEDGGKKYVVYQTIVGFCNGCSSFSPMQTMDKYRERFEPKVHRETRAKGGKEPLLWHSHQSFNGREVTPQMANEIGRKFAEEVFKGFPCVVTTHTNGDNIHNHFMFSAWDDTGKKWNNCNANYRLIRKISDRLCQEYGLSVLENTRDVKLVKYKDAEGKTRFYEPTDRKNEIIRKREEGKAAKGDANDYRNTTEYEKTVKREMSVRETVKRDIDTLLPSCRSYEELLLRLRELGYHIKDKKVDGTWLSHVTFQPPGARKGVRDNSLGDGLRYTRIVLTAELKERGERIWREEQANGRPRGEDARNTVPPFVPYFEEYEYGKTDLLAIDDTYRSVRREDGGFDIVERSKQERKVLSDIRETDREIKGLIDTTELHRMVAEVEAQRKKKKPYLTKTEEQRLLVQLQQSFECLRYTEKHGVYSYGQMLDMYKANRNTFNNITENLEQVKKLLATMQTVSHAPMMVERITARMEKFKDDEVYLLDKYHDDKEQLARWRSLIAKHGLATEQGQAAYAEKISGYAERIAELEKVVAKAAEQMAEIENCVYTYDRIDRKHGISNADFMERFERVKAGLEEPLMDEEDLLRSDLEEEQEEEYEPERSEEYRERER